MKAATLQDWQKIVVEDVAPPKPEADEVILKVSYGGVCGSDVHIFNGHNPIAKTPVIQGHEFTGSVAEVSNEATGALKIGQRVVAHPLVFCGTCTACRRGVPHVCENLIVIGVNQNGGFAEYVRVAQRNLTPVADGIPDTVAVLAEPFSIGYHACRRGGLQAHHRVLVIGAGPIGFYAGIVARKLGANDVVFSEPLAQRREQVVEFGFKAFDPADSGWAGQIKAATQGEGFDIVIETSGVAAGLDNAVAAASVRGNIVSLGFPAQNYAPYNITRGIVKELSIIGSRVCPSDEFGQTVELLENLFRSNEIDFDRIIADIRPLEDLASAIEDTRTGRLGGKILIKAE